MASAAYDRRNAAARAKGYSSYYDYRAHDNGRLPPGAPREAGAGLRRARGHASLADLERLIGSGRAVKVLPVGLERDAKGRWTKIDVLVLVEGGAERHFILRDRQASEANLKRLRDMLVSMGVGYQVAPSLDVFAESVAA